MFNKIDNMKRIISIAIAALTFISFPACEKQDLEFSSDFDGTLVFTSQKPVTADEVETRTGWTGSSVQWLKDDKIRVGFTLDDAWQSSGKAGDTTPRFYASEGLSENMSIASFSVPFGESLFQESIKELQGNLVFYGIYPSKCSAAAQNTAPIISISIPSEQTPSADSFDPLADILYGQSETLTEMTEDPILMNWNRIVALGQITLNNLTVNSGEQLQTISFTAQDDADLVGTHKLNVIDGSITATNAGNVITANVSKLTIASDKTLKVWISLLPETLTSLTVAVETNKAVYTRSITGISKTFVKNKRNILGISMASAKRVEKEQNVAEYPYTEPLTSEFGKFTYENIGELPSAMSYIWTINKCAKAGAYVNNTNYAVVGWLYSPIIDLSSATTPTLYFDHAISKYFGEGDSAVEKEATVWVREKDGDWSQIEISYPEKPTSSYSEYLSVSVNLSAYKGKKVQVGFKYASTTEAAGTWEVKNFSLKEYEAPVVVSGSVSFEPSDFAGQGTSSTGSPVAATKDGFTFNCDKAYGTTELRCYKGSSISITAPNGKTIKTVSLTFSGSYTGALNASYTVNSSSWNQSLGSQARITKVVIEY